MNRAGQRGRLRIAGNRESKLENRNSSSRSGNSVVFCELRVASFQFRQPAIQATALTAVVLGLLLTAWTPSTSWSVEGKPDLIFVQTPKAAPAGIAQRFPEGSRLVRFKPASGPGTVEDLTPDFFSAADPQVSFDATEVLFAGKKQKTSPWQIWEVSVDGSTRRQLTHCDVDCLRPAYLPRNEIVYTAVKSDDPDWPSQLYVSKGDGSDAHAITFGPGNFLVETVLQDGRILVSASAPLKQSVGGTRGLYTLRSDGSNLASFRCDHRPGILRGEAAELEDGSVVFVKKHSMAETGGELAIVRRGSLHNSPVGRVAGLYLSAGRWEAGRAVVALKRPPPGKEPQTLRNSSALPGKERFDLYSFDVGQGRIDETLFADANLSSLDAVPVSSHKAPRWYWSTLNLQLKVGYFICLNSRLSMDAPGGRFRSDIAKVRLLALDVRSGLERNLGEAAVEPDGSFYIAVPSDQPVRFELLNASGKSIHAQQSWIWARSGEERGCIGCHEDKAVAPDNNWPQALRRFDTPIRLGVQKPVSAH